MKLILLLLLAALFVPLAHACDYDYECGYQQVCRAGSCIYDGASCKYDLECKPDQYCAGGYCHGGAAVGGCLPVLVFLCAGTTAMLGGNGR